LLEVVAVTVPVDSIWDCGESLVDDRLVPSHTYETVQIGNQCWMAENLAFLPQVSPSSDLSEEFARFYVYDYEGISVPEALATWNYNTYGVLYNYHAALGACPYGWHLPADNEWDVLSNYLGGNSVAGGKMKSTRTATSFPPPAWNSPNSGASNSSGFSGLPGGDLRFSGFVYEGYGGAFKSSSLGSANYAKLRALNYGSGHVIVEDYLYSYGCSVRCVRD